MVRMADRLEREGHPVAYGLLALVGVAVVVGVVAGLAAIGGAKVAGLDGRAPSEGGQEEASLFLPKPKQTRGADGPLITLAPGQRAPDDKDSEEPGEESSSATRDKEISLEAARTAVGPMDNIDLTGVYGNGEGAILQVQRFESGSWSDFPVTASVTDKTFTTYVQTGQTGVNRFRVIDTDTGTASNQVKVRVG